MKTRTKKAGADAYLALVRRFPLRPIRTAPDRDAADEMIAELAVRTEDKLDAGERDYLDVLSDLVETYDQRHHPMPARRSTPLQRLRHLLDQSQTSATQLRQILQLSQPQVSLILSGRRSLSKSSIQKLARHFRLEPGYFI